MTAFTVYITFMLAVWGLTILWALGRAIAPAVVALGRRIELQ